MGVLSTEKALSALTPLLAAEGLAVAGLAVEDGRVTAALRIDPARAAEMEPTRRRAEEILRSLAGVTAVSVVLTADKKPAPAARLGGHAVSSRPPAPQVRHILAVASGKGGVGKSTVAANLALAFSSLGKTVGLLDADIYGASQPRMMGLRPRPDSNAADMIVPPLAHGIKVMSMGFFVEADQPVIWRGPMVHSAIQQLFRDVAWGPLDVLVVDLPPGTGDAQLSLAQNIPLAGAVIVSTPQDVALGEAMKALRMFEKTGVPVLGMAENMSTYLCAHCGARDDIFDHGGAGRAARDAGVPFLGEIPLDAALRRAGDAGAPLVAAQPGHPIAAVFRDIARQVWEALAASHHAAG